MIATATRMWGHEALFSKVMRVRIFLQFISVLSSTRRILDLSSRCALHFYRTPGYLSPCGCRKRQHISTCLRNWRVRRSIKKYFIGRDTERRGGPIICDQENDPYEVSLLAPHCSTSCGCPGMLTLPTVSIRLRQFVRLFSDLSP